MMEEAERPRKLRKLDISAPEEGSPLGSCSPVPSPASEPNVPAALQQQPQDPNQNTDEPAQKLHRDSHFPIDPSGLNLAPVADDDPTQTQAPLSKTQLKKLRRKQAWEDGRAARKERRKEKLAAKKAERRKPPARPGGDDVSTAPIADADEAGSQTPAPIPADKAPPRANGTAERPRLSHRGQRSRPFKKQPVQVPLTIIIDCSFDSLMLDKEIVSLGSQITRSYSDCCKMAPFRPHLVVSSFGGRLRERFEGVLASTHRGWKGVRFTEEDYVAAAEEAMKVMRAERTGGTVAGALMRGVDDVHDNLSGTAVEGEMEKRGEVVYLTSDSPETLTRLSPYSTYIVGGLVDRNRHKGICYKRAMDQGIKTAKLPIGDYLQMSSRSVLATNHVVEIILRWLELGDWGQAFVEVVPKRKGGVLKTVLEGGEGGKNGAEVEADTEGEGGEEAGRGEKEAEDHSRMQSEHEDAVVPSS